MAGILSSRNIAMRAVDSFDLFIEKRQDSKEKKSHSLDKMYGNKRLVVASKGLLELLPYMKTFFFLE
jgi:hypothetical protein